MVRGLEYNLLYRWFVGLGMDDRVWVPTTFTKNRDRLLAGEVARAFFDAVPEQAADRQLLSSEHFSVDGCAERSAALEMLGALPEGPRVTLGADRGYDTSDFVAGCRALGVTPHVAQNTTNRSSHGGGLHPGAAAKPGGGGVILLGLATGASDTTQVWRLGARARRTEWRAPAVKGTPR